MEPQDNSSVVICTLSQMLSCCIWFESQSPLYYFIIDEFDWCWTPRHGFERGKPELPTCIVKISVATIKEILRGSLSPQQAQQKGLILLGGLLIDAIALSRAFLPEKDQLQIWRDLFNERDFNMRCWSSEGRRSLAESIEPSFAELEHTYKGSLGRVRKALNSWVGHRINQCRLNQLVRFDVPELEVFPWVDSTELDQFVKPHFAVLRQEAMQFLDGRVTAPHYGGDYSHPDDPQPSQPKGWRSYNLVENFEPAHHRLNCFPVAAKIISNIMEQYLVVHAGFLILEAGVVLPAHSDGANWLLSYQFGLIVPNNCYLEVDGERRFHREGCGLVFNDSFLHSAANEGESTRILFCVLFANKDFNPLERAAFALLSRKLPANVLVYSR